MDKVYLDTDNAKRPIYSGIEIPFTREEWNAIICALEDHETQWMGPTWSMEVNIIDRIEKSLGIE